jgi:enoyl-CoA hydratase
MSATGEPHLLVHDTGTVLQVAWNRPERRNALTTQMVLEAASCLRSRAPENRVVVFTGTGGAFSAGADLAASSTTMLAALEELVVEIVHCPVPVLAVVDGVAAGAGCSIALAADVTIAGRTSSFLLAFRHVGLMPDAGATLLVAASAGRATAMRLALLGEQLPAEEALAAGLIAGVVEPEQLQPEAERITTALARGPHTALAATKSAINQATLAGLPDALHRERLGQRALLEHVEHAVGVEAFYARRAPEFPAPSGAGR